MKGVGLNLEVMCRVGLGDGESSVPMKGIIVTIVSSIYDVMVEYVIHSY